MKIYIPLAFLVIALLLVTCNGTKDLAPSRIMRVSASQIAAYHPPVSIQVGWFPYEEDKLVRTGKNDWKVVKNTEGSNNGVIPQILISYPNFTDSIWLDMNIDDALLGKLIKHTVMTQVPIERPFGEYFETARCSKCHPSHIKIDYN